LSRGISGSQKLVSTLSRGILGSQKLPSNTPGRIFWSQKLGRTSFYLPVCGSGWMTFFSSSFSSLGAMTTWQ
jgi:hypothetical protein